MVRLSGVWLGGWRGGTKVADVKFVCVGSVVWVVGRWVVWVGG